MSLVSYARLAFNQLPRASNNIANVRARGQRERTDYISPGGRPLTRLELEPAGPTGAGAKINSRSGAALAESSPSLKMPAS